ncbi:hypothetical protein Sjap_003608 [Stephania japonica]|uniref:BHLH domain-containing protein n=1 Tax=Stephania japonica TaxID=461633 RepID=A0AAP0PTR1_9MAGN
MAGDLDQLYGHYNNFTPTYSTTFRDDDDDPLIFDFETNDLLDQFAYYSTINNSLNDLQCLNNYSTNNYAYYPPSHDLLANPNYVFSLPDDDQLFEPYYPPSKRQKIVSCGIDQYAGYNCCPVLNNSAHTYSNTTPTSTTSCYQSTVLIDAEGLGKKTMALMKDDQGMSAQSVAARQRRRRITEKTRELGELVPGGNKMNTAEMFHSAFKYIKFLQAQVGVLEFMSSIDMDNREGDEQMQVLLASPIIQEKLYSAEKCLVPKQLIEISNAKDQHDIKTNTLVSKENTDDLLVQQADEKKID